MHCSWEKLKENFTNINEKDVTDNKTFWKSVKPFRSDKTKTQNWKTEILKYGNTEDAEVAVNLEPPEDKNLSIRLDNNEDPISNITEKYKNRPSVIATKNVFLSYSFIFETISRDGSLKEIKNLHIFIHLRKRKKITFQRKL